jgi:hypothetical protein
VEGHSIEVFEQVKSLVKEETFCTLGAIMLAIALVVGRTFISEHLLNEDGQGLVEILKGDKLHQVMEKFLALFSPNVWNLIVSFKHQPRNKGYVSSILTLKTNNGYCCI